MKSNRSYFKLCSVLVPCYCFLTRKFDSHMSSEVRHRISVTKGDAIDQFHTVLSVILCRKKAFYIDCVVLSSLISTFVNMEEDLPVPLTSLFIFSSELLIRKIHIQTLY